MIGNNLEKEKEDKVKRVSQQYEIANKLGIPLPLNSWELNHISEHTIRRGIKLELVKSIECNTKRR